MILSALQKFWLPLGSAIVLFALAAGCGGGGKGKAGDAGADGDAGVSPVIDPLSCRDRDRAQLEARAGQPCNTIQQCLAGMFCDVAAGGICAFSCAADADCGAGEQCSCAGQCVAATPADDACGRSFLRLQSASTLDRECSSDDECPSGAFCSSAFRRCRFDCLRNADCPAPGQCGCDGRCAAPPAGAAVLPVLTVSPEVIELAIPAGASEAPKKPVIPGRPINVVIKGAVADAAALPVVWVEAGPYLRVRCGASGDFRKTCQVAGFTRAPAHPDGVARFETIVTVRSDDEAARPDDGVRTWSLRFMSGGIARSPVGLTFFYSDMGPGRAAGEWSPLPDNPTGGYRGVVRLTPPDGAAIETSVKAVFLDGKLVLHDDSGLLSASGLLPIPRAKGVTEKFVWYAPWRNELRMDGQVTAFVTTTEEMTAHPGQMALGKAGGIAGGFEIAIVASLKADQTLGATARWVGRFDLQEDASVKACAAPADCGAGTECRLGHCTVGPDHIVPAVFKSTLSHQGRAAWLTPARVGAIKTDGGAPGRFVCATAAGFGAYGGTIDVGRSGDVACSGGGYPAAFPLLTGARESASAALGACLEDGKESPPAGAVGELFTLLGGDLFFRQRSCLSLGHFLSGLEAARRPAYAVDYGYLLSQWAQVHAFIARQGASEQALDAVLKGGGMPTAGRDFDQALDALERAWGLIATELNVDPAGAISDWAPPISNAQPDYRSRYISAGTRNTLGADYSRAGYEAPFGLAPILLSASADHLNLVVAYIDAEARKIYGLADPAARRKVLSRYTNAIRLTAVMEALAFSIHDKAVQSCKDTPCNGAATPPWETRFTQSVALFVAARTAVYDRGGLFREGRNPLGIEDNDVPLYFGDVQGEVARFFAASSYLVGQADAAVASALASLEAARTAWSSQREAAVQDQLQQTQKDIRLDEIERQFGQPIIDSCGLTGITSKKLWADIEAKTFFLSSCHMESRCVGADPSPEGIQKTLANRSSVAHLKKELCQLALLGPRLSLKPGVAACLKIAGASASAVLEFVDNITVPAGGANNKVTCGSVTFPISELYSDQDRGRVPAEELAEARVACEERFGGVTLPMPELAPTCYRGQMGSAAARITVARQEMQAALSRQQTAEVRFEKDWELCQLKIGNNAMRLSAQKTLETQREAWRSGKKLARETERNASIAEGALQGAITGFVNSGGNPLVALGGALIGGGLSFLGSGAAAKQKKLDDQLRDAEASYSTLLENLSGQVDLVACLNELDVQKSAILTEIETIKTQSLAIEAAILDFTNVRRSAEQTITEGLATLQKERERSWGGFAHHFWFDEKVQTFEREFPWAQRLVYLALRALEYELQQTLTLRDKVIAATHPDQLKAALMSLASERDNLRLNGARPAQGVAVLSLRDDLLGLANDSKPAAGERELTAAQRFGARLASTTSEVRDEGGVYLGRGLNLSLTPGMRGLLRTTLPNRCAERLWQVTATVVGDGVVTNSTRVALQVRKRNTFSSQLCKAATDVQTASIQPSRNLFKPGEARAVDEAEGFTDAAIMAPLNVPRAQLESDAFSEGVSSEMAGYGLYGDYVVFFPKAAIEAGLNLGKVEDIVLRFTYLSVDDT